MKNRYLLTASILAVAVSGFSQVKRAELPSMSDFHERMEEPAAPAPDALPTAESAGCPIPSLDGAVIGRGWFSSDYKVSWGGKDFGKISQNGDGYIFNGPDGGTIASGTMESGDKTRKLTVSGCDGAIGAIVETDGADYNVGSSYKLYDASGSEIGAAGPSEGDLAVIAASGEKIAESKSISGMSDKYEIAPEKVDGRLMAMAAVMQNAAAYRRSAERRRDMPHEPHGPKY